MRTHPTCSLLAALLGAVAPAAAAKPVDMTPAFVQGDVDLYEIRTELTHRQGVASDADGSRSVEQRFLVRRIVESVTADGATIELRFLRAEMTTSAPGGELRHETGPTLGADTSKRGRRTLWRSRTDAPFAPELNAMVGRAIHLHVSPAGRIISTEIDEALHGAYAMSDDAIRATFGPLVQLGTGRVAVGGSWTVTGAQRVLPRTEIVATTTLTLDSVEAGTAFVSAETAYEVDGDGERLAIGEATSSSRCWWDLDDGQPVQLRSRQHLELTIDGTPVATTASVRIDLVR